MKFKWMASVLLLLALCLPLLGMAQTKSASKAPSISPQLHKDLLAAIEKGVTYLLKNHKENGCWEDHIGISALAVTSILKQPGGAHKQGPEVKLERRVG